MPYLHPADRAEYAQGLTAGRAAASLPPRELIALFQSNKRKAREHIDGDPPFLCGWLFAAEDAVQRAYGAVLAPAKRRAA